MAILVIDDHPMMRFALSSAARVAAPAVDIVACQSIEDASRLIRSPQRIVMALLSSTMAGDCAHALCLRDCLSDEAKIVLLDAGDQPASLARLAVKRSIRLRAVSFAQVAHDLRAILQNCGSALTPCVEAPPVELTQIQRRVMAAVARGMMNKQIAFELGLQESTVKFHLTMIFRKLGVTTRSQAIVAISNRRLDIDTESIAA